MEALKNPALVVCVGEYFNGSGTTVVVKLLNGDQLNFTASTPGEARAMAEAHVSRLAAV
jgi:hypothetical protein